MNDWERLQDWLELLDDGRLACLVEIAAVLAADQMGVYSDPPRPLMRPAEKAHHGRSTELLLLDG